MDFLERVRVRYRRRPPTPRLDTYVGSGRKADRHGAPVSLTTTAADTATSTAKAALSVGAAAVGASVANATADGSYKAHMDGSVLSGASLTIQATATNTATTIAEASGGGLISAQLPLAFAEASPSIQASVGNGSGVNVTGAANISATSNSNATASAKGLSVGLAAVGVMESTANVSPTVNAFIDSNANVTAGSIALSSAQNITTGATATSEASGGGIFSGMGAVPTANANATLDTYVGSGAKLNVTGAISVTTTAADKAISTAKALVGQRGCGGGEHQQRHRKRVVQGAHGRLGAQRARRSRSRRW